MKAILCRTSTKDSYAMHTIKITPNLLFEYQCTSGKFIRLPNRIESKLEYSTALYADRVVRASNIASLLFDDARAAAVCGHAESPTADDPQFRDAAALS